MNKLCFLLAICALAACSRVTPTDTVDSLVAHPDHLHAMERQCASNDARVSAAECEVVSEARRRLFYGNGPQYTPSTKPVKF